jgi:hypothetical protein
MKVLIGCEYSDVVASAFRAKGHEVISCDLEPSETNSPFHYQGPVEDLLRESTFDLIIIHPPCTALTVAGNATYGEGQPKYSERLESVQWTMELWEWCKRRAQSVCLENPVGVLQRLGGIKKPSYVHPWQFGHMEQKKTGLYLHNLEPLKPTHNVYDEMMKLPVNKRQRVHYLPPSPTRWKERSRTFTGIAEAMAEQWG